MVTATDGWPRNGAEARGLQRPAVVDGLRQLAAVVGPAEALSLWSAAAQATARHGIDLDVDDHLEVLQHLVGTTTGAARVTVLGLMTRLRAFRVLERSGA